MSKRGPDHPHTASNGDPQRQQHIYKRHTQGLTVRDIAKEFGTSKSTVARMIRSRREAAANKLFPEDNKMDGNE